MTGRASSNTRSKYSQRFSCITSGPTGNKPENKVDETENKSSCDIKCTKFDKTRTAISMFIIYKNSHNSQRLQ